ncbi:MAG: hypothetical protein ACE5GW_00565 [Planctomycetota bacterium]
MKKILAILFRGYCLVCGLLVTPTLLAIFLASTLGVLSGERIAAFIAGEAPPEAAAEATAAEETEAPPPDGDQSRWERRLEQMGAEVLAGAEKLGRERERLDEMEERQTRVSAALAPLLGAIFDETVDPASIAATAPEWTARLERRGSQEERLPALLQTLKSVEPRSLAAIFAGDAEGETPVDGLQEDEVARLLAGLPPRMAGEILTEMGKLDPGLAGRLVASLGARRSVAATGQ